MLAKFSGVESERTASTVLCKRNESELHKPRTFVSDENSTKFRRIYCASPCEISEAR